MSRTGTAAFSIDWDIASGTATAGVDFDTSPATLTFAGGQTSQTISVTISGDTSIEADETFFVRLANATNGGAIADDQGMGLIANDDVAAMQPMVVAIRDTTAIGSPDPSGLAYVNGTLFLCDSEVNEAQGFQTGSSGLAPDRGQFDSEYGLGSPYQDPGSVNHEPR